MSARALHDLTAAELAAGYAARRFTPVEVLRDLLRHAARWEPHLHALYALDPGGAMDQAEASQARWLRGQPLSALDGVPATVKENIPSRGVPTPLGSAATELAPATEDAPPVARLRESGAVIVAKTTMPDYGMLTSGLSSFHPLTRNPWNLAKNPGGSSAGAAAAAAAGFGPLHLGTDIGGSVRLPAAFCGVFGLKPSLGRVPISAPYAGRVTGPITRSVGDAALLMATLSRPDWRDATGLPAAAIDWTALEREPRGLRLALLLDPGWGLPVDAQVREAVVAAARRFEAAGAVVQEIPAFGRREHIDGMDAFWRMRFWLELRALPAERRARVLPYIRAWAEGGAALSGEQVFRGYSQMAAMRDAAVVAMQGFDFLLSPTCPVPAYAAEWASPTNDPARPLEHIAFTLAFNMSEQPAASIDCGRTADGLPIGLQIAGHRHDDLGVLQVARLWELLRPAPPAWPQPPA